MQTNFGWNLFDKLIKPILLYGCELLVLPDNKKCLIRKNIEETYEDGSKWQNPGEKVGVQYIRQLLGVHKRTSVQVVRGELGFFPIYIDMLVHLIKYWHRVANFDVNSLISNAYNVQQELCEKEKPCWLYGVTIPM